MINPTAIEKFLSELDKIGNNLIGELKEFKVYNLSEVELYEIVNEINFFDELNQAGYLKEIEKLIDTYKDNIANIIEVANAKGLTGIGTASIEQLESLADLDGEWLLKRGEMYSDELKKNLLTSIVSGTNPKEFFGTLLNNINETVPFKPNWLQSALHTSYANFNAVATKNLFKDAEEEIRFKLKHPYDDHTRKDCVHAIKIMAEHPEGFTITEIDNGSLGPDYTFINRGGFNCRGWWVVV